jgi:hypothetical protein
MSEQEDPKTNELEDAIICPHCEEHVLIEKLNCCIFRHGIIKDTLKQMDPHCSKEECDRLFSCGLIYGCGKPFKITKTNDGIHVEICEYI